MEMLASLIMWPRPRQQIRSPIPVRLHKKLCFETVYFTYPAVLKKMFENVDRRTNGRACLYFIFTYESKGSGELKKRTKSMHICLGSVAVTSLEK